MILSLMYISTGVASVSTLKTSVVMIIIEWSITTNSGIGSVIQKQYYIWNDIVTRFSIVYGDVIDH